MRVLNAITKLWSYSKLWVMGLTLVIVIVSIDANAKPYLIKMMIDHAVSGQFNSLWLIVFGYACSQILNASMWSFSDWMMVKHTAKFRVYVNTWCLSILSKYPYTFFQDHLTGSLINKLADIFNRIHSLIFTINYQFNQFIITTAITLYLLSGVHIYFALGLFGWILVFLTLTLLNLRKSTDVTQECAESKSALWGQVADYLSNILNVRLFSSYQYETQRLDAINQNFIAKAQVMGRCFMIFYIIQGIIVSVYALSFIIGLIYLLKNRYITPGDFTLVIMLNFKIFDKMYELSHQFIDFMENWGSVDQALKILEYPLTIQDKLNAAELKVDEGRITFKDVHFHYIKDKPLFENLNVTIEPGQKVGLVGYSGSGKSTFVRLLLRLYDGQSGTIMIDDQSIVDVTQDSLRCAIALIPQEPELFHRSLIDNIRYGRPTASDEEVFAATHQAQAHNFITALPQGYDSLVGERGVKLSGGQRQRIAIARAILKDAPILILDEATSQLDSVTENDIQRALLTFMAQRDHLTQRSKTTIIIAHRLSTLLHMNRILVFHQGKIIEDGDHKELLAMNGHYKSLWDAQIGGFLPDKNLSYKLKNGLEGL